MVRIKLKKRIDFHNRAGDLVTGRFCSLIKHERIDKYAPVLKDLYPEVDKITLKVFKEATWGNEGVAMAEASAVQNVYADAGLAPRVYNVIHVNDNDRAYLAQVTEEVSGEKPKDKKTIEAFYKKLQKFGSENHLGPHLDLQPGNLIGDKWVDFQGFVFLDNYAEQLKKDLTNIARWQSHISYQAFPEIGVPGERKVDRIKEIGLAGMTVLDIGCSAGKDSMAAIGKGASRVFGVDTEEIIPVAKRLAAYMGVYNVDYYGYNLKDEEFLKFIRGKSKRETFDVILMFSMHMHIGFPKYIRKLMHKNSVLLFEGNRELDRDKYEFDMTNAGLDYKIIDDTHDLGARHLYLAAVR